MRGAPRPRRFRSQGGKLNPARVAALFAELAAEFRPPALTSGDGATPLRKRRPNRGRSLVRPDDEETPEHIKALAARSLRERGFR